MKRGGLLKHEFVEFIPDELKTGTIYVSMKFATAAHLCCCGCGNRVVTPLRPTDWALIFDGKTISLTPSIGNWSFACRSHYWIRRSEVRWAAQCSQEEIDAGRSRDRRAKHRYFKAGDSDADLSRSRQRGEAVEPAPATKSVWQTLKDRLRPR